MNLAVYVKYNDTEYVVQGRYIPVMRARIGSVETSAPEDGGYWSDEIIEPEPEDGESEEIIALATEEAEKIVRG